jgi:hypothetical protein
MLKSGWIAFVTGLGALFSTFLDMLDWPIEAVLGLSASFCAISIFSLAQRLSTRKRPPAGFDSRHEIKSRAHRYVVGPILLAVLAILVIVFMRIALANRMSQTLRYGVVKKSSGKTAIEIRLPAKELQELSISIDREGSAARDRLLCEEINVPSSGVIEAQDPKKYTLDFYNLKPSGMFDLLCPWTIRHLPTISTEPRVEMEDMAVARRWRISVLVYGGLLWIVSLVYFEMRSVS